MVGEVSEFLRFGPEFFRRFALTLGAHLLRVGLLLFGSEAFLLGRRGGPYEAEAGLETFERFGEASSRHAPHQVDPVAPAAAAAVPAPARFLREVREAVPSPANRARAVRFFKMFVCHAVGRPQFGPAAFRRALHSFQSVRHESLLTVFGSRQKDAPAVRKTKKTLPTDAPRRNILLVVSGAKRNTDFLSTPVSRQRAQGNHYTEEKENSIDRERVTGFP